jgi:hypothetical protein
VTGVLNHPGDHDLSTPLGAAVPQLSGCFEVRMNIIPVMLVLATAQIAAGPTSSMADWLSHFVAFVVGVGTGALGVYFASKYTDKRRDKERAKSAHARFAQVCGQLPKLIEEMRSDVKGESNGYVREFFIISSRRIVFNYGDTKRFSYFAEDHEDLKNQIQIVESYGYVTLMREGDCPMYRMTEEFVGRLLGMAK